MTNKPGQANTEFPGEVTRTTETTERSQSNLKLRTSYY